MNARPTGVNRAGKNRDSLSRAAGSLLILALMKKA